MADKRTLIFIFLLMGGIATLMGGIASTFISLALHSTSAVAQFIPIYNTFSFYSLLGMMSGIMLVIAALEVHHNRRKGSIKYWSTVALAFAVISLFDGGGLVLGFILAIIGSMIGLTE
ncbi:MAG TPA: hypothetical protein VND15_03680 [Candidatus Acidoferrales bacterium]|nr:hypothetical protein [Candidatus Acidoferrales bacterium]